MSTATRILTTWTTTSLAALLPAPQRLAGTLEVDPHDTWDGDDGACLSSGPGCQVGTATDGAARLISFVIHATAITSH